MPFLTFQVSPRKPCATRAARREGGAAAVKIEGGRPVIDAVRRMVDIGIPVMGQLGLTAVGSPVGRVPRQARARRTPPGFWTRLVCWRGAGAFALVLESIPAEVAAE